MMFLQRTSCTNHSLIGDTIIDALALRRQTMQTFIPYPDFQSSASVLDRQRLGKQRVETLQILNALAGLSKGWVNHPATKMWGTYESALLQYGLAIVAEWRSRGYKDTCEAKMWAVHDSMTHVRDFTAMPPWLGLDIVHDSHKSNLLRKNPEWYSHYNWNVPDDLPYEWPTP